MSIKNTILISLTLIIGITIGFIANNYYHKTAETKLNKIYEERHEGMSKLINPLLACDVAAEVLSDPELGIFKKDVEQYLNTRISKHDAQKVSVYFRELNDGLWFSIGDTEKYVPASLRKIPLMIALLKQSENDKILLEREVKFEVPTDNNLKQNIKPSHSLVAGNMYTIRDLIYRMVVYSDNDAFFYLTKIVNPDELKKVYSSLRMLDLPLNKSDSFLSIQTYESFFRILYNASYLTHDASNWALDLMTSSEFKAGLIAGVPSTVKVAHKFGEHSEESNTPVQLHDCGIIYYPKHPYLLCVMTQGTDMNLLADVIAGVSRTVYTEINNQANAQSTH